MKLGIIGTGKIVNEALFAMEDIADIEINAIYARPHSREKGVSLAEKYSIKEIYTEYDELLDKADIDTVYIGLVNSAHYEYAIRAVESGINVILEKPFTSTLKEARDLIDAAREHGVYVLEAITILYGPVYNWVSQKLSYLSKLKIVQSNYSQYSSRYDKYLAGEIEPAFDPELSGGALYDINLYNIYMAVGLLGEPVKAAYYPNLGYNGIDTSGIEILQYDGYTATLTGAKDSDSPSHTIIQGEKGYIKVLGKPNVPEGAVIEYADPEHPEGVPSISGGRDRVMIREEFTAPELKHRMTPEFETFADIIDNRNEKAATECMENSLRVMNILESSRKGAGIKFGVD